MHITRTLTLTGSPRCAEADAAAALVEFYVNRIRGALSVRITDHDCLSACAHVGVASVSPARASPQRAQTMDNLIIVVVRQ